MKGSRMFIYKQDPSVDEPGVRTTYISSPVLKGPQDELIRIADVCDIEPSENGDFLIQEEQKRLFFDAVHVFAVCRQVLTLYERVFNRLDILDEEDKNEKGNFAFRKKWGKPLDVYIRAMNGSLSAIYTSGRQTIFFGYKKDVFTCRSFDIIAHEIGHAIFNVINRKQSSKQRRISLALEEAFCDLTVLFTLLSQMDMCETVTALSKGNLHSSSSEVFISGIAEQCGMEKFQRFALRDISKKYYYNAVVEKQIFSVYDLSLVFSSAVYGFLAEQFDEHICLNKYDPAETLYWVGKMVTEITIGAFYLSGKNPNNDFKSVATEMIRQLESIEFKKYHECVNEKEEWHLKLAKKFEEHQIF